MVKVGRRTGCLTILSDHGLGLGAQWKHWTGPSGLVSCQTNRSFTVRTELKQQVARAAPVRIRVDRPGSRRQIVERTNCSKWRVSLSFQVLLFVPKEDRRELGRGQTLTQYGKKV